MGEVLLPQAGREEVDVEGRMGVDPLQDIDEVGIGIDPVQTARGEEALHNPDVARAHLRPAKKPIAAAEHYRANLPL